MSAVATERFFYRTQILANAEVIFPSHDPKLITTKDYPGDKRRIRIISSMTGEVLLEQDGVDDKGLMMLFGQVERMLAEMVKEGCLKGARSGDGSAGGLAEGSGDNGNEAKEKLKNENEALRRENEVLKAQLIEKNFDSLR